MTELKIGDPAPDFTLKRDGGTEITLSECRGSPVVLFFYPKDDTSGCTKEAIGFSEEYAAFQALNAQIFGISRDSVASHDKFRDKHNLTTPLLSDENGEVTEAFGVWVEKSMYGKKYMGIERATYLIDREGNISEIWRKVRVPGHVAKVKKAVEALST